MQLLKVRLQRHLLFQAIFQGCRRQEELSLKRFKRESNWRACWSPNSEASMVKATIPSSSTSIMKFWDFWILIDLLKPTSRVLMKKSNSKNIQEKKNRPYLKLRKIMETHRASYLICKRKDLWQQLWEITLMIWNLKNQACLEWVDRAGPNLITKWGKHSQWNLTKNQ